MSSLVPIDWPTDRPVPPLSVVIVAWRRDQDLPLCIDAVLNQTLPRESYEVIVVDNGENPMSAQVCSQKVDLWYDVGSNLGCSGGRNLGARLARGAFLAFVDDDGVIERDFLRTALLLLQSRPCLGGIRGRVVYRNHRYLTMLSGVYDLGPDPYDKVVLDCEGASIVRTHHFRALGGFDERLAGGEGLDWTVRLMLTYPDMEVAYEPGMVMRHDYVDSLYRYISKVHMNRRGRHRQEQESDEFRYLNPPPGLLPRSAFPDKRPFLDRAVCKLGRYLFRVSELLPEIEPYRRK